jgi:hypothetical protein
MSATIPRVTLPPAEQTPPRIRAASTMFHDLLAPARICQMLTVPSESCMMGQRPKSSDHGAHSSHPIPYGIRNQANPARALVKWLVPRL